jgi:hypothetical protein
VSSRQSKSCHSLFVYNNKSLQFWAVSNLQVPSASGLSMPCCGALLILNFKAFALGLEHLILFAVLGALLFC